MLSSFLTFEKGLRREEKMVNSLYKVRPSIRDVPFRGLHANKERITDEKLEMVSLFMLYVTSRSVIDFSFKWITSGSVALTGCALLFHRSGSG